VVVNTITGLGYAFGGRAGLLRRAIVFFWRRICGTRTWISFQNPDDLAMFRQLKLVKPERAFLIAGSGVNTQVYAPTPATAGPGDAPRPFTFLMFSRMMWEKGVREYIEAAEWVSRECATAGGKGVRFVLLGGARPGNSTGVLTEWIAHPRTIPAAWIEERVRAGIVEWHPHDDAVLPYLREADAVVLPSYYREGIPRSLLEAMSCGKAIITTDTPGCRDTVVDGANGILVQPRDVRSLARAMAYLARDPEAGARMGTASRRIALERFSDEVVVQRTFDLYRRAGLNLPPERGNSRLEGNENRCPS
jgi:glycosyltransferase involved in cell wall biosynthesis